MTESQWIILIASFFTGGAMGSIITAFITSFRNRRQPIAYKLELIEIFKKDAVYGYLQTFLTVTNAGNSNVDLEVENLSVAHLILTNKGNQDIEKFKFGINFQDGTGNIIDVKMETPDRHHIATSTTLPTVPEFKRELDFILEPFNRGDIYSFNIYYTYSEHAGEIKLSSPHSTKFVEIGAVKETTLEVAILIFKHAINQIFRKRLP